MKLTQGRRILSEPADGRAESGKLAARVWRHAGAYPLDNPEIARLSEDVGDTFVGLNRGVERGHGGGVLSSNENKMSDDGRIRASLGVEVWKSSQKWSAQRSDVRS